MATNKVTVAHERAKMKLRSDILTHRVRIEENKQALIVKRKNLAELTKATKK